MRVNLSARSLPSAALHSAEHSQHVHTALFFLALFFWVGVYLSCCSCMRDLCRLITFILSICLSNCLSCVSVATTTDCTVSTLPPTRPLWPPVSVTRSYGSTLRTPTAASMTICSPGAHFRPWTAHQPRQQQRRHQRMKQQRNGKSTN